MDWDRARGFEALTQFTARQVKLRATIQCFAAVGSSNRPAVVDDPVVIFVPSMSTSIVKVPSAPSARC